MAAVVSLGASLLAFTPSPGQAPSGPALTILYPKHQSAVGRRINVVLDPATDWSAVPLFQVSVGSTAYPVVDTSSGRHAQQGVALGPGLNTVTVKALAPEQGAGTPAGGEGKKAANGREPQRKYAVLATRTFAVYNREGSFAAPQAGAAPQYFHTREHESECAGCHRLDAGPQDRKPGKPEEMLCYACHRDIPTGKHIHGPAAVWNCLGCHDPDLAPVKYQFTAADPWKAAKTIEAVAPAVFTIPADALFKPFSATLLADDVPPLPKPAGRDRKQRQEQEAARNAEIGRRKERQQELLREFLEYARQNPADKVRVEVHAGSAAAPEKGRKGKGVATPQQLTDARAKALARLLRDQGLTDARKVTVLGMGTTLPKSPDASPESQALNERIEIVVHSADRAVQNSLTLPALTDRQRVTVTLSSTKGPAEIQSLRVIERLPRGLHYVKGTGSFRGAVKEPQVKGDDLVWALGNPGADFQETLSFVVTRDAQAQEEISPVVRVQFTAGRREETRELDPQKPFKAGLSVLEICGNCHGSMLEGKFKHGPAEAGYCTLCHDPHASNYPAWTRRQSWRLCTTCHAEKRSEVHVIKGFVRNVSHPTKKYRDPARPGKRLSCISCHSPHSAETPELLAYEVRNTFDLCNICHPKK